MVSVRNTWDRRTAELMYFGQMVFRGWLQAEIKEFEDAPGACVYGGEYRECG